MEHAPTAAATSASGEASRASDAIADHEGAVAHHLVHPLEASVSTPFVRVRHTYFVIDVLAYFGHMMSLSTPEIPAVRESTPLPRAEAEWQAVSSTEIDQQTETRYGGGNAGSLMTSSGVNQAGSKRKADASATGAKRAKQVLAHPVPEQVPSGIVDVGHQSASGGNGVTTRSGRAASESSPNQSEGAQSVRRKKNGQPRRAGRSRKTTQSASSDPPVSAAELRRRHHRLAPLSTFPDWGGVETALSEYASATGFSFGVRNCKKLADKTTVSKMTWTCSRAGKPRSASKKQPSSGKSPGSLSMRCQCPVSVTVWRKSDGILYISKSELGHNHTLDTSAAASAHLTVVATEREESARFEKLKTHVLELLRQASKSEVATKWAKSVLDQLQSDLSELDSSSDQNTVPEPSNCDAVANRGQPLAAHIAENDMQEHEDGAVLTADPRAPTQTLTPSLSCGSSNHGTRLDTMVSPDSPLDDVERVGVQPSPNLRRERQQRADMSELLRVVEVLNQGFHPPEKHLWQGLTWDLVKLLNGVLSTYGESQLQHTKLREAIHKWIPFVVRILREKLEDTGAIQLILNALCVLQSLSSNGNADIVVKADAVPCLLQALHSDIPKHRVQAALCLSDIASTSTDFRMVITKSCSSSRVLSYLQDPSPVLRSAAESLLRSLFDFPNVMERDDHGPELIDVLASILLQRSRDKVRKYIDMRGGGELVLTNKAAPISFWRVFEIKTGKPAADNTDRVRVIREIDATHVEVKSVARDVESLQHRVYRVKKLEIRSVKVRDVENNDPEEKDLLSEDELRLLEYCSALRRICLKDGDVVGKLVNLGLCPLLFELLYVSNSTTVCSAVLDILRTILCRRSSFSHVIIDSKLLEGMPSLLQSRSRKIREGVVSVLLQCAHVGETLVPTMIQSSVLATNLVEVMEWGVVDARRHASYILEHMIRHATPKFATQMIDQNVIKMFSEILHERPDNYSHVGIVDSIDILTTLNPIESRCTWEECDLLSKIEELTSDVHTPLRKRAAKFMKKWNTNTRDREIGGSSEIYSGDDEDDDEDNSDEDDSDEVDIVSDGYEQGLVD